MRSLGPGADTIPVEVHHRASRGSPDLVGNPGGRTVGWAEEVHRGCSREERGSAEDTVEAVAGAAGFGSSADLALSAAGQRKHAKFADPVAASAQTPELLGDEHSVAIAALAICPSKRET